MKFSYLFLAFFLCICTQLKCHNLMLGLAKQWEQEARDMPKQRDFPFELIEQSGRQLAPG